MMKFTQALVAGRDQIYPDVSDISNDMDQMYSKRGWFSILGMMCQGYEIQ